MQATPALVRSRSVAQTRALGAALAANAQRGDVIALVGPLGAGKTEFVRGFVAALAPDAPVKSPSFTLLNVYDTPVLAVYHFDLYRIARPTELAELGLGEYLDGEGVCLVEWADKLVDELPPGRLSVVRFEDQGDSIRLITIERPGERA